MAETTQNTEPTGDDYSLSRKSPDTVMAVPNLPYMPRDPKTYRPNIGLIACGGITEQHLRAYKKAGYNVVMLCDIHEEKAKKRQEEFFPDAAITTDYKTVLTRPDIEVVDIATHPHDRASLIEDALNAGKHVLSQKPFVLDLEVGEHLIATAKKNNRKLAVNQNGRWAPHVAFTREAIKAGLIGDVLSIHMGVHWNHSWVKGTPFEQIRDLILYDFSIHWFDMVNYYLGNRKATRVFASRAKALGQTIEPPLMAQVLIEFDGGQCSLTFDAFVNYGQQDRTYVSGTHGTIHSTGPNLSDQKLTLYTGNGYVSPILEGNWFPDGFHGTMAELLCAIEEDREPSNSAEHNLSSLALCFAAIASATDGEPKTPGSVRKLPPGSAPGV